MNLTETLEIILITYNRKDYLEKTLNGILAPSSPVKGLDITVLDNFSTDGTSELVQEFAEKYPNLKHVIHNRNIGGNANITRAFEIARKPYLWVLCDDDNYDWSDFGEIEKAIEEDYDLISTIDFDYNDKNKLAMIFYNFAFVPGFICKTENLTFAVMENATANIGNFFPQLAIVAKCINEEKRIKLIGKDVVLRGKDNDSFGNHYRGLDHSLCIRRRNMFWFVGYVNACQMIDDKEKRDSVIENLRHYSGGLFELFLTKIEKNKLRFDNYDKNLCDMFCGLSFKHRMLFVFAFVCIRLKHFFAKKVFFEPASKEDWLEYFEYIGQQKKIDKLAKKYKNKKILIYGAGMILETLIENYDLSKLDIIGVSDRKFECEQSFMGYKAIPSSEIGKMKPDVVMVSLYKMDKSNTALKTIKARREHIIKKNVFVRFALRY